MEKGIAFETPKSSFVSMIGTMHNGASPLTKEGEIILNVDQISAICDTLNGKAIISLNNGLTIRTQDSFEKIRGRIMESCNYIGNL